MTTGAPLRRFLYLTPYFPPQRRVGALRPLKFARHLPDHGWAPVVLADLGPNDTTSAALVDAVPATTTVLYDYSGRAQRAWQRFAAEAARTDLEHSAVGAQPEPARPAPPRWPRVRAALRRLQPHPEWLPLGEHSPRMRWAYAAGQRALRAHRCEAIVVNADPYAAMLVGRALGRAFDLPVIHDLRDPWSVCDLRRPHRPPPQRWLVDRLERACVEDAARFVVNTETALADYRAHYPDVPAERFACIRNHGDAALIDGGSFATPPVFTALFLGNFRRFIDGRVLFEALARLRDLGLGPARLKLRVTGAISTEAHALAASYGVADMLEAHPFVPYHHTGRFMASCDLLVAVGHATRQRIPAKVYDYATSRRPVLVISDNAELRGLIDGLGGATMHGLDDSAGIAQTIADAVAAGRQVDVERGDAGLDSATASARLAAILDDVTRRPGA
jgi:hypothetical protein